MSLVLMGLLGVFTFLLFRAGVTSSRFLVASLVWIIAIFMFLAADKIEALKVFLQSFTVLIAVSALFISIFTFALQQTPTLILDTLQIREAERALYLYIKNVGTIGAWQIKGSYALTATNITGEPGNHTTEDEQLLAFDQRDVKDEAFYPGKDNVSVVVWPLTLKDDLSTIGKHVFFSVVIEYPRLQVGNFSFGRKGYQGVFSLNEDKKSWVTNTKTLLPEYFKLIFDALKVRKAPEFR